MSSDAASAAYRPWRVEDQIETFAEGLATRTAFDLPQRILRQWLDDFVLVARTKALIIETARNLVEAAGAVPLNVEAGW